MNTSLFEQLRKIKLYLLAIEGLLVSFKNNFFHPEYACTPNTIRCCENRKSPSFNYHVIGRNIPVCCASHLVKILFDVVTVLDKHKIQYFISFGTLLGAVRHKGIIPWDTDIDIIIAKKDQKKAFSVLKKDMINQYFIQIDANENIVGEELVRVYLSKTNTLHVDLFPYIEKSNKISFYENKTFKIEEVFPLKETKFYNFTVKTPRNIEDHLLYLYGDDHMKYAYKQWAANKNKFKIKDFSAAKIKQ